MKTNKERVWTSCGASRGGVALSPLLISDPILSVSVLDQLLLFSRNTTTRWALMTRTAACADAGAPRTFSPPPSTQKDELSSFLLKPRRGVVCER